MKATALLVLILAAADPAPASEVWRGQSRRTVAAAGLEVVAVHNGRGRIEARPSADRDLHVAALKIVRAPTMERAQQLAVQTLVELSREGSRYVIRVKYPKTPSVRLNLWEGFSDLALPRVEVRIALEVPVRLDVDLHASSGDLSTQGLVGSQSMRSASGDVAVESAKGPVAISTASGDVTLDEAASARISTASGDVQARDIAGRLVVTTSSGDVEVGEAGDSLRVETVSGDVVVRRAGRGAVVRTTSGEIALRDAAGSVLVATVSGEVQVGLSDPLREASVTSSSGDIHLALQDRMGCTLDMRTNSGTIDVDLPVRTQTVSRRHVTAVVRAGTAPVSLRSASGSITVSPREP